MKKLILAAGILAVAAGAAEARDQIHIAGSSTVLPYAQIVAEAFGKAYPNFKSPVVESGGTGAGIKQFCQGAGEDTIDIANASRPMKDEERRACVRNGVKDIVELKFGYDGIVFASNASMGALKLTTKDVYLALAAEIPLGEKFIPNPNKTWKDVNPALPAAPILAFIPGEKHGTREVFEQKTLGIGCAEAGGKAMYMSFNYGGLSDGDAVKACSRVRKDGATVDIDGDYTETLARLASNKTAVGVFGLSFYENNKDKLRVASVNGVTPDADTVATGKYLVSRPLFFYVKKAHVGAIPGLQEYAEFFVSDKISGPEGPLVDDGLVPAPKAELKAAQDAAKTMKLMN